MPRIALLALVALLALPAPAGAAIRHLVRGAGYGHGVGMSQYGAFGFAREGRDYKAILRHYYTGTELSQADTRTIRVLLQTGQKEAEFTGATRLPGRRLDPDRTYTVRPEGFSSVELRSGGEVVDTFTAPLEVTSAEGTLVLKGTAMNGVRDGTYRGGLEFRPATFGGITVVNPVNLDDYVQGVVPGEVPASWPAEALKAQAVAARTYALATDAGGAIFDQYPDTRSQVYRGLTSERPQTNAAVQATAGEVVRHQGKIATTYFFSTSGGRTENVENSFYGAKPTPYLVSVKDPYDDASPKHRWRLTYTTRQMKAKLGDYVKGRFRRIKVIKRGVSPRVVWADVVGSRGTTRVRGADLRRELELFDTWAYFTTIRTERARSARGASWLARLVRPSELSGSVSPRPRGGLIAIERRSRDGGWRRVRRVRTSRDGAYRVVLRSAGVYRVRAGWAAGPPVRLP